ncbi:hypothetical protein BT93_B0886 [Corymbia citriodora subsp. variegata]|nr:hypothetical protein BT93_B0886 [Corymbia citriodora subsp. variegata]
MGQVVSTEITIARVPALSISLHELKKGGNGGEGTKGRVGEDSAFLDGFRIESSPVLWARNKRDNVRTNWCEKTLKDCRGCPWSQAQFTAWPVLSIGRRGFTNYCCNKPNP